MKIAALALTALSLLTAEAVAQQSPQLRAFAGKIAHLKEEPLKEEPDADAVLSSCLDGCIQTAFESESKTVSSGEIEGDIEECAQVCLDEDAAATTARTVPLDPVAFTACASDCAEESTKSFTDDLSSLSDDEDACIAACTGAVDVGKCEDDCEKSRSKDEDDAEKDAEKEGEKCMDKCVYGTGHTATSSDTSEAVAQQSPQLRAFAGKIAHLKEEPLKEEPLKEEPTPEGTLTSCIEVCYEDEITVDSKSKSVNSDEIEGDIEDCSQVCLDTYNASPTRSFTGDAATLSACSSTCAEKSVKEFTDDLDSLSDDEDKCIQECTGADDVDKCEDDCEKSRSKDEKKAEEDAEKEGEKCLEKCLFGTGGTATSSDTWEKAFKTA